MGNVRAKRENWNDQDWMKWQRQVVREENAQKGAAKNERSRTGGK